jgi:hypothetical protein
LLFLVAPGLVAVAPGLVAVAPGLVAVAAGFSPAIMVAQDLGPAGSDAVQVSTSLSQTALWPGDDVLLSVELKCAPNIDVLDEDLAADKFRLDGLEIAGTEIARSPADDGGVTVRASYHLTSYEIEAPALRIGDRTVRYYVRRPGQRVEDISPAGEIRIPGTVLTLRSTLPDDRKGLGLRTGRGFESTASVFEAIRLTGFGLLILSAAPIGLRAASVARRIRLPRFRVRSRSVKSATRSALDEIRAMDESSSTARREAFVRLDQILRRHLAETAAVPTFSLTADELAERLPANGRVPADSIRAVLTDCERAAYSPANRVPGADRLREAVETVQSVVLGSHR